MNKDITKEITIPVIIMLGLFGSLTFIRFNTNVWADAILIMLVVVVGTFYYLLRKIFKRLYEVNSFLLKIRIFNEIAMVLGAIVLFVLMIGILELV